MNKDNNNQIAVIEEEKYLNMQPMQVSRELRKVKTKEDVMELVKSRSVPSIAKLKKQSSENKIIAYISMWLIDLNVSLNIKNPMSEFQIEECAYFILDDYYYLTIADFKLFFTNIKKGKYGKLYEAISTPKIMDFLHEYTVERTRMFEFAETQGTKQLRKRENESIQDLRIKMLKK